MASRTVTRLELARLERDHLLRSLEDLDTEHHAGDVESEDYDLLRRSYIARTGALLDEIALLELRREDDLAARPLAARLRRLLGRRRSRRVLVAAVSLWLIAGVSLVALHFAGVRLPGQSATGSVSLSQALVIQQELTQASDLAGTGQIAEAIALYSRVLVTVPHQHEALTYQGWLIRLSGLGARDKTVVAQGDAELALAASVAPAYPDARGLDAIAIEEDRGDNRGAILELTGFVGDHPSRALVSALRPEALKIYQQAKMRPPAIFAGVSTG